MNKLIILLLVTMAALSCTKKDRPVIPGSPAMKYIDLQNAEVTHQQPFLLDINSDGITDFSFSTLLVGDPVLGRDRLQFYAYSKISTCLLNDSNDESPVLVKGDRIAAVHTGYLWWEISAIVLAEKITRSNGSVNWEGRWNNANHRYLPVSIKKSGETYYGWVELSMDTHSEKMILHRSAICIEADLPVKAGH